MVFPGQLPPPFAQLWHKSEETACWLRFPQSANSGTYDLGKSVCNAAEQT